MNEKDQVVSDPTEVILYREPHNDDPGTWQDRLYQCGSGVRKGIGISVGGLVYVKPLKEWHSLESQLREMEAKYEGHLQSLRNDWKTDSDERIAFFESQLRAADELAWAVRHNLDEESDERMLRNTLAAYEKARGIK